ncbi:sialate O-acetylesterase [Novosphingobium profundi]|uniref:sialate O-acetylesterase n=1 Tax=Novosphingobium profundi TaxID=1774954 RepID=UPI001BDB5FA1|nr:sialate O-acetylesterase [Novosphingobium profundi]MBT0669224.1 sialate O-acetylesterase [Novosphingobium profundi]
MMRTKLGTLLAFAALSGSAAGATPPALAPAAEPSPLPPATRVYVLAGQSNMSGRGLPGGLTPAEQASDPAIRVYGNDGRVRIAREPLDSALGQIDAVSRDTRAGVGPGLFFARALRRQRDEPVLLVPCAKGGSRIASWQPGGGRDTLYGSCLARIRELGGHVDGVLWYQGESDAEAQESAAKWGAAFVDLVGAFRHDLAQPTLPVVFVQLADTPDVAGEAVRFPGWAQVQAAQAAISVPCTAMVSAKGAPRLPDRLHLTTAAQRKLGGEMAEVMERLSRSPCAPG